MHLAVERSKDRVAEAQIHRAAQPVSCSQCRRDRRRSRSTDCTLKGGLSVGARSVGTVTLTATSAPVLMLMQCRVVEEYTTLYRCRSCTTRLGVCTKSSSSPARFCTTRKGNHGPTMATVLPLPLALPLPLPLARAVVSGEVGTAKVDHRDEAASLSPPELLHWQH